MGHGEEADWRNWAERIGGKGFYFYSFFCTESSRVLLVIPPVRQHLFCGACLFVCRVQCVYLVVLMFGTCTLKIFLRKAIFITQESRLNFCLYSAQIIFVVSIGKTNVKGIQHECYHLPCSVPQNVAIETLDSYCYLVFFIDYISLKYTAQRFNSYPYY